MKRSETMGGHRFPVILLTCVLLAQAQEHASQWFLFGGDLGRTGWEQSDPGITKESVKRFQQVLKHRLKSASVTPPVLLEEPAQIGIVADGSDRLWAIDLNSDQVVWERAFKSTARRPCMNEAVAMPAVRAGTSLSPARSSAAPQVFALSADGKLHIINTSTGEDTIPAIPFVPPMSIATSVASNKGLVYTTTLAGCGAAPGVWALDLTSADLTKPVAGVATATFPASTLGDAAFGSDGTVYVQTGGGLEALDPKTLKVKHSFAEIQGDITPIVFEQKNDDRIVTASASGSLYLLTSRNQLYSTQPLGHVVGLSSWRSPQGVRYVLATVNDTVMAFRLDNGNVLAKVWVSPPLDSPLPTVIAGGIVFVLSKNATLWALDGDTGQVLYTSNNKIENTSAGGNGMTVANGRVYFSTTDGNLYAFGASAEK